MSSHVWLFCDPTDCRFPPKDCSLQAPLSMGVFPGKNSGVSCHFFLQGIFLTQGSNLSLLHWQVGFFYHWATRETRIIAAAAAKSLQLCPTLCDPIDSSPPGSAIPRILQARTLECVAISFSNAWKWKVQVKSLSRVRLLRDPMDCSPPGSSIPGIFQARLLEWGASAFLSLTSSKFLKTGSRSQCTRALLCWERSRSFYW